MYGPSAGAEKWCSGDSIVHIFHFLPKNDDPFLSLDIWFESENTKHYFTTKEGTKRNWIFLNLWGKMKLFLCYLFANNWSRYRARQCNLHSHLLTVRLLLIFSKPGYLWTSSEDCRRCSEITWRCFSVRNF